MIYGIGTDIVSLKRIIRLNKKFGLAFAQRILSPEELLEFPQAGNRSTILPNALPPKRLLPKPLVRAYAAWCLSAISVSDMTHWANLNCFLHRL